MPRTYLLPLLLGGSLSLGGCAASLAASAVGAVMRSTQARSDQQPVQDIEALKLSAAQACRAHASQFGTVHIIDLEPRDRNKIIVWGTATSGPDRRSFNCTYTNKIVRFKFYTLKG